MAVRREAPGGAADVTLWVGGWLRAGVYSSMIPLLRPMIAACVRSLASSFDKNALDPPLDRVLGDAELIRDLLVRVPGRR